MKPILIIPPDEMSQEDIAQLRENGVCVVSAKSPQDIRFLDVPAVGNHDEVTRACIALSRYVHSSQLFQMDRHSLIEYWAKTLFDAHKFSDQPVDRVKESAQANLATGVLKWQSLSSSLT